jgi:hypothetical protein
MNEMLINGRKCTCRYLGHLDMIITSLPGVQTIWTAAPRRAVPSGKGTKATELIVQGGAECPLLGVSCHGRHWWKGARPLSGRGGG